MKLVEKGAYPLEFTEHRDSNILYKPFDFASLGRVKDATISALDHINETYFEGCAPLSNWLEQKTTDLSGERRLQYPPEVISYRVIMVRVLSEESTAMVRVEIPVESPTMFVEYLCKTSRFPEFFPGDPNFPSCDTYISTFRDCLVFDGQKVDKVRYDYDMLERHHVGKVRRLLIQKIHACMKNVHRFGAF